MKLDIELYDLLTKYLKNGDADITRVMAILANHLTMIIQSCVLSPKGKLLLAKQVMNCVVQEIKDKPVPILRSLN